MERRKSQKPAFIAALFACFALGQSSADARATPNGSMLGPSFSCAGRLNETERAICGDGTLSAYDRALAWSYGRGLQSAEVRPSRQIQWLSRRNACEAVRQCILAAYRDWVSGLDLLDGASVVLERINSRDWASLSLVPLGEEWYLFQVSAMFTFDMPGGKGRDANDGGAVGVVQLTNGRAMWSNDPENSRTCQIEFSRRAKYSWTLRDNDNCGGVRVTLDGDYRRL